LVSLFSEAVKAKNLGKITAFIFNFPRADLKRPLDAKGSKFHQYVSCEASQCIAPA
jgi:hypothetical protein